MRADYLIPYWCFFVVFDVKQTNKQKSFKIKWFNSIDLLNWKYTWKKKEEKYTATKQTTQSYETGKNCFIKVQYTGIMQARIIKLLQHLPIFSTWLYYLCTKLLIWPSRASGSHYRSQQMVQNHVCLVMNWTKLISQRAWTATTGIVRKNMKKSNNNKNTQIDLLSKWHY